MAAGNQQFRKTALDRQVVNLGESDDSLWDEAENQHSPALGELELPDDFRLHQFGEFTDQPADDAMSGSASEPTIPSLSASNDHSFLDNEADSQLLALLQRLTDRRLLLAGLFCSLILHLIVGTVVINFESEEHVANLPTRVQVRLLPAIPSREILEEAEESEEINEETGEQAEEVLTETLAETEPQDVETSAEEFVEESESAIEVEVPAELIAETTGETETPEESAVATEPVPLLPTRSLDIIQSAIQQDFTQQQLEDRSWASTCNQLQRQSGVIGCAQQDEPDLSALEQSLESRAVYEFHNPVVERSRAERSISSIAANSAQVAANLTGANIPEGLSDYMMAELEGTITLYSGGHNRVTDHMERMLDTSNNGVVPRSLADSWVRHQIQQRQQRRYYSRQDLQRMAECSSLKVFVLALSELEKFADCTTRDGNLVLRLLPLLL